MNPSEPLLGIVLSILESEPKPLVDIVQQLAEYGIISNLDSPSDELSRILDESDAIWGAASGLYNRTDKMLEGACLTHRITAEEIENDLVHIVPDLDGLAFNLDQIVIPGGRQLRVVFRKLDHIENASDNGSYLGPPGWLNEFLPGDLIAFRRTGNMFSVFRPKELYRGDEEQVALLSAFKGLYTDARGVEPLEILLDAMCDNPTLFRDPVPPIHELTQSLLLEPRGIWLGPMVENWNTPDEAWQKEKKEKLAENLGFEPCCIHEFDSALAAWKKWRKSRHADLNYKSVLNSLYHGAVAMGFTSWVFQFETFPHRSVDAFMTDLVASGGSKAAAAYYVRAISRSLEGKAAMAEKDLRLALQYDPKFELAKIELASSIADRGDIHAYLSALRHCNPNAVLAQIKAAEALLPNYPPTDRNDFCPCGSGLKYKACCLKAPKLSTNTRIAWLTQKVTRWMARVERQENLSDFFLTFNKMLGEPTEEDYGDFILDVAMFEGRGIEEYLDLRGELLSPPDRQLLEAMNSSKRALFEIVGAEPGHTLTLRDTLTGEQIAVVEHLGSLDAKTGDYMMSRTIATPNGHILVGQKLRILLRQRDALLELLRHSPEPFDFLSWLSSSLKPPRILNFEGEEIVFCKALIRPAHSVDIGSAFTREFGEASAGKWSLEESNSREDLTETAALSLENGLVAVETSSVQRLERTLKRLKELIGDFEVEYRTQQSINSNAENYTGHIGLESVEDIDTEMQGIISAHIERMEDRWLNESIPALGGLTPRQALNDPTRREDLIRLLNEFERKEIHTTETRNSQLAGFKTARIRKKLGLD